MGMVDQIKPKKGPRLSDERVLRIVIIRLVDALLWILPVYAVIWSISHTVANQSDTVLRLISCIPF